MKTLKITMLLLAVLLLSVSGLSRDAVVDTNEPTFKKHTSQDLMVMDKKKMKLETHG